MQRLLCVLGMFSLLAYANVQACEKKTGNNISLSHEVSAPDKRQLSFLEIVTKTKSRTSGQVIIHNKEEVLPKNSGELPVAKKKKELKITHDDRVLRWFDPSFIYPGQDPTGIYHTLLPLKYDEHVVKHGRKSFVLSNLEVLASQYSKKRAERDPMYRVYGIVRFNDSSVGYYEFHTTIGRNGVCYHRGCSKLAEGYEDFIDNLHSETTFNSVPEQDLLNRCKLPIGLIDRKKYNCTIELYEPMVTEEQ